MITKEQIKNLDLAFKRIFVLPITKMTIRELQETIGKLLEGKQDMSQALFDSLIQGKINDVLKKAPHEHLTKLLDNYSSPFRVAVEIAESGEFINTLTCDQFQQNKQPFFVNRVKRIDGQEFQFLSLPDTTVRLAQMFVRRIRELRDSPSGSQLELKVKQDLEILKKEVEALLK